VVFSNRLLERFGAKRSQFGWSKCNRIITSIVFSDSINRKTILPGLRPEDGRGLSSRRQEADPGGIRDKRKRGRPPRQPA